jgi:uncharacterized membrane protein YtjA (UPF0391 family)
MYGLAIACLIVALVAGILGFGGVATGLAATAQAVFFVATALFALAVLANALRGRVPRL